MQVEGLSIVLTDMVGSTGMELKVDPGVPFVYAGFAGGSTVSRSVCVHLTPSPYAVCTVSIKACTALRRPHDHLVGQLSVAFANLGLAAGCKAICRRADQPGNSYVRTGAEQHTARPAGGRQRAFSRGGQ